MVHLHVGHPRRIEILLLKNAPAHWTALIMSMGLACHVRWSLHPGQVCTRGRVACKGVTQCAAKIPPLVPSAPSAPAVEIPEIPLVENQTETSEISETPAEVREEIEEEEKEDRQEELEEEKNLPTPTEPEEPPSKVEGCRYPREIKDEKSGFCRPRYKKDCGNPGYIDPISQQCQDLPANDGQYSEWSLQICNQYLDGVKTFYETLSMLVILSL